MPILNIATCAGTARSTHGQDVTKCQNRMLDRGLDEDLPLSWADTGRVLLTNRALSLRQAEGRIRSERAGQASLLKQSDDLRLSAASQASGWQKAVISSSGKLFEVMTRATPAPGTFDVGRTVGR